ncbi:MAG: CubicO group peptidase (beta-lactamase class C family) [Sphingobacteriales bacterium]|jgi:CubicO group peptidase (beta-lactamase class C family)
MMMRRLFAICFTLLSIGAHCQWESTALDSVFYEGWKTFGEKSGVSIGIIRNGEVVYANGFGKTDLNKEENISGHSVFPVASISKAFTATLLTKVIEDKGYNWDTKVESVYPAFDLFDNYVENNMTFKDLLNHRNGYKTFDGDLLWYYSKFSTEEALKKFAQFPPNQNFRDNYGYQNTMFMVAAMVVEQELGMSWSDAVNTFILTPLEMTETSSNFQDHQKMDHVVYPVLQEQTQPLSNFDNAVGAVGINSTVTDLMKWMAHWLDAKDERIISTKNKAFLSKMHLVQNEINGAFYGNSGVGLGWFITENQGKKQVSHSGGLPGFIHNLVWYPELNSGVVALSNGTNYIPFAVSKYVGDLLMGEGDASIFEQYKGINTKNQQKDADAVAKILERRGIPSLNKKQYLGNYQDNVFGEAIISKNGGQLFLDFTYTTSMFKGNLISQGPDQFIWKHAEPFLPMGSVYFQRDVHGEIESFKVVIHNHDFHFDNLLFEKGE